MKFIPILFSTPMVQAILDDRKTMTRRIVKPQPSSTGVAAFNDGEHPIMKCPYGKVGDVLWVRETFRWFSGLTESDPPRYKYAADEKKIEKGIWKPSLFMPKAACRTFLQITNIRVERLQDITSQDAEAEGVKIDDEGMLCWDYLKNKYRDITPDKSFQKLWQSINGTDSWDKNPFVWVINFKRIEKPENFN